jgi:hypothetical protein
MNSCYATVLLDDETWRSLVALNGDREPAWVHGCALEQGHEGNHASSTDRAGSLSYWIQWADGGRPRISTASRPPRVEPHPVSTKPAVAVPPVESASQTEALWAIARALERLADACVAMLRADEGGGRHSTGGRG